MPTRKITSGEERLLRSIFGSTLPYSDLNVARNDAEYGGRTNSITFAIVPNMAPSIWAVDYSDKKLVPDDDDRWTFVHEMAHVWNWYHGGSNMRSAVWIGLKTVASNVFAPIGKGVRPSESYEDAYAYDLSTHSDLRRYNIEQQASIVADAWYVSIGRAPQKNTGTKNSAADYDPFIKQVRTSGPPEDLSRTAKYASRPGSRPL